MSIAKNDELKAGKQKEEKSFIDRSLFKIIFSFYHYDDKTESWKRKAQNRTNKLFSIHMEWPWKDHIKLITRIK